ALADQWSDLVQSWFIKATDHLKDEYKINTPYIFSLLDTPEASDGRVSDIFWNGYPRKYKLSVPDQNSRYLLTEAVVNKDLNGRGKDYRYLVGDNLVPATDIFFRDQDEYCEWKSFHEQDTGKLKKVIFTCENPEYWSFIFENDSSLIVEKYREVTGENVVLDDLIFSKDIYYPDYSINRYVNQKGKYNPHNKWNSTHNIVHLSHPANSLSAEVFLAADATILRKDDEGKLITNDQDLICCAGFGGINRSSDPTIGSKINTLVRKGFSISINDPVGLYIHSLDSGAFEFPQGIYAEDCWKIIRGRDSMILRAEFSLPEGSGHSMEDIKVGGAPLKYGGQIAEYINVVIYGKGYKPQTGEPESKPCSNHCCVIPGFPNLLTPTPIDEPCVPAPEILVMNTPLSLPTNEVHMDKPKMTLESEVSPNFKRI
ncbi:MAG: hypothetical protein WBG62_03640, partial [Cyclobacteriaceae bacterium]